MTKLREPGSHHEALQQSLAMLGDAGAEAATGKSSGHLRACSNPDETREVLYVDAVQLSAAIAKAGGTPPLLTHLRLACERVQPMSAPAPADPRALLLDCVEAVGDLSGAFRQAMADGSVCARERQQMRALVADLRKRSDELWAALEDPQEERIAMLAAEQRAAIDVVHNMSVAGIRRETQLKRERARRISLQARLAEKGKGR
ncbi:hypothetical protein FHP25_35990 [Vineibacter terrae]|uniref:Uncharacterized protein n=1 Tax=Vineibacter terrae TaxID=2586908 RepID=A0A5C8P9M8_9HYPH|nr:phage regulatory CII family protein [Vineibacter terrae]TXL70126.1 hypothetical protein FHP25_35990 [Vineibacter terrae]